MKTIFTLTILAFSVCSFGQKKEVYAKTTPGLVALTGNQELYNALTDTMTIRLQPYQKQILSKLDSVQKAFAADVEKNKEVIATFNALMQRSASIQERSKDAQDLIFGDHGIDPKKYRISGGDLIKGTLKIERIKEVPYGGAINK